MVEMGEKKSQTLKGAISLDCQLADMIHRRHRLIFKFLCVENGFIDKNKV